MDTDRLLQKYRWFRAKQRGKHGTDITFDDYVDYWNQHIERGGTEKDFVLQRYDLSKPATLDNTLLRPITPEDKKIQEYIKGLKKSSRKRGLKCTLRIEDIKLLLKEANATIYDIGFAKTGGKNLVMCRSKDQGDYELGNVRIGTVQENTQEYFDNHGKWWISRGKK